VALIGNSQNRLLRYAISPQAEPPSGVKNVQLVLLPFWHLGGLIFSWQIGSKVEILDPSIMALGEQDAERDSVHQVVRRDSGPNKVFQGRVLDLTLADPAAQQFGIASLHHRASVFALEPFSEAHQLMGHLEAARFNYHYAHEHLLGRAMSLATLAEGITRLDCRRFDLVADRLSLIYYPFWVELAADGPRALWDAVSGYPEPLGQGAAPPGKEADDTYGHLILVALKCQDCGSPLPDGNRAMILPCCNCGKFWRVGESALEPFEAQFAMPRLLASELTWLPYWQVPVKVSYAGRQALTVSDLIEVLGVLRPPLDMPRAAGDSPLCYYVAAFGGMQLPRIDHSARDMTRFQPQLEALISPAEHGLEECFNCFFTAEDAQRLAYVSWIQIVPGTVVHRLRSLRIHTGQARLWYVPFEHAGRELVNLLTGLRYDWAVFRGVRH
jgi:hypothetical protein